MVDCVNEVAKAFADVPKEQIERIVREIEGVKGKQDFAKRVKALRDGALADQRLDAYKKLQRAVAERDLEDFINRKDFEQDPTEAFLAKFAGIDRIVEGGNLSFESSRDVFRSKMLNTVRYSLGEDFNWMRNASKADEKQVAKAMDLLNQNNSLMGGELINAFPSHIQRAARGMRAINKTLVEELQKAGVLVRERADYIGRQTHNSGKMVEATKPVWIKATLGKLDPVKTFGSVTGSAEQEKILEEIFEEITSTGMSGGNIGDLSGRRSLHFKSGEDWVEYNREFGHGNLIDTAIATIGSSAKNAAISQTFGTATNARKLWSDAVERTNKAIMKTGDTKKITKWKATQTVRKGYEAEMFGFDNAGLEVWGKTAQTLNAIQRGALLGKAAISAFTDVAFSSFSFRAATGGGRGVAEWKVLNNFKAVASPSQAKKWQHHLDLHFSDMLQDTYDRFGGIRGKGGVQRVSDWAMKASGVEYQSSRMKTANARLFAGEIGVNATKGWKELDPRLTANLSRFGILEADWGILRKATETIEGAEFTTPEAVSKVKGVESLRLDKLRRKYSAYLLDNSQVGSPQSSGRERSIVHAGMGSNHPLGAILRVATQFKSFAFAVPRIYRRISLSNPNSDARTLRESLNNVGDLSLVAGLFTEATIIAGGGILIKDSISGKKRDLSTPQEQGDFILESITRGAVPLMASYVLDSVRGEYNKYGRNLFVDMVGGPSFGQIQDLAKMGNLAAAEVITAVMEGELPQDSPAAGHALRILMRNMPGQNLPFVQPAMNKAFLTDLHDYLNPGYAERMKSKVIRNQEDFLFDPYSSFRDNN